MLCALYTGALEVTTSYNYILVKCLIVNLLKELYLSRKWGRSYMLHPALLISNVG